MRLIFVFMMLTLFVLPAAAQTETSEPANAVELVLNIIHNIIDFFSKLFETIFKVNQTTSELAEWE